MESSDFSFHISFMEIARNPYFLDLYRGMNPFLKGATWWIIDQEGNQTPLYQQADSSSGDTSKTEQQNHSIQQEGLQRLLLASNASDSCILPCCDGYVQGIAGCWYRNRLIGGIGICHVPVEHHSLLKQFLQIIDGYLTLLSGALEDHDDLELVHNVWSQTITKIDLNDLLPSLMSELCTALGISQGVILLVNEDAEFFPVRVCNYPQEILKRRTLEVTYYEYLENRDITREVTLFLSPEDPLRKWLQNELAYFDCQDYKEHECLAVPFLRNDRMVGIFLSFSPHIQSFSYTKLSLIRMLATSGAAALDNALTVERMEKRRKALSTIHVIHRLIGSNITEKELLPRIGQLTKQLMRVRKCSIMLRDEENNILKPVVTLGLEKDEVGQNPLKIGEGLPGWVAENFNPILYHPRGDSVPPWKEGDEKYPSESYLAVALFDNDVEGVITVSDKDDDFNPGDREILLTFAEQIVIAIKSTRLHEGERTITINALKSIANLIETQDPQRDGITVYTCEVAQQIAQFLNLSHRDYHRITYASLLHDIGMIQSVQSDLSQDELRMKGPQVSLHFVKSLGLQEEVGEIVYHVNEAWNGQGYPDGLKGNEIPLGARIIAVANAYATLIHRKKEPDPQKAEKAFHIINKLAGRSYDPDIIHALKQVIQNQ